MDKNKLKKQIDVAAGRAPADLCIKNCRVIDVFNKTVFSSDVLVTQGMIAGFGDESFPDAAETFDAGGAFLAPGLIDSHVHIESSHLSPEEFSRLVVPCGTTTVIADPHEICNVCGVLGFDYMLTASEDIALQVMLQFPSCVPATPFENAGAVLTAPEIRTRIGNERVAGLGEMMNYPGVCSGDDAVLDKLMEAKLVNKVIDGHSPDLSGCLLDAYTGAGIKTDHECATPEELRDRIRRGVYVMLREGTACHDLLNLLPGVDISSSRFCLFCTDDCQAATILERGHIDNNIRLALSGGLDLFTALSMATINPAICYGLNDRGAVAPGRRADLILFKDPEHFSVSDVWIGGRHVAGGCQYLVKDEPLMSVQLAGMMNVSGFSAERLALRPGSPYVRTIRLIPYSVVTEEGHAKVTLDADGCWVRNEQDIVKLAVIERHHGTGNIGLGLLEGFGLRNGAIATSIAHDSHNIIVAGDNDADIEAAVRCLISIGGGIAIASGGKIIEAMAHEIGGLMTHKPAREVADQLSSIDRTARDLLGIRPYADPIMTMSFMALPVIPKLKLTDKGLFDVSRFSFVPVGEKE